MSSPRKFAEKIALLQQKQAEGDAAFKTIIHEVEAAKQRTDCVLARKNSLNVPPQTYEIVNAINNSDNHIYVNQSMKLNENGASSNRLLLPPENPSWRRTHSDPLLHQNVIPNAVPQYHAQLDNQDNNQQLNFDHNCAKFDANLYSGQHLHCNNVQVSNPQFQSQYYFDLNNNNYGNNISNNFCLSPQTLSSPQQTIADSTSNSNHTVLDAHYSSGNTSSNVLLLPPNQHSRGNGGSLPDLRIGSPYNNQQISFSAVPLPSTSTTQQYFRSSSPQQNNDTELYTLGSQQQQSLSRIGPVKQNSSMRRRHSPMGDHRQPSSRQQHSPSPDTSSNHHLIEAQSPQSQSSYSPQNSPHFLSSPGNELSPFSPPQQQQSTENQKSYFQLSTHFDQITLDNNYYAQQQPTSPSSQQQQQQHNHLTSATSSMNNDLQPQLNFYSSFMDDISLSYSNNQATMNTKATNQKSSTIPNIILTDADSSKLDLLKELGNDFSNTLDSILEAADLQLNNDDDFLLNVPDLSVDPTNCDDTFCMER